MFHQWFHKVREWSFIYYPYVFFATHSSWYLPCNAQTNKENLKFVLTILSLTQTSLGPVANLLVAEINTSISIGSLVIPVNPYNSVGLIVAVGEVILWLTMLLFLREPPAKEKSTLKGSNAEQTLSLGSSCKCKYCVWYTLRCKLPIHVSHPWSIVPPYSLQSYGGLGSCDFSYIWMGASSNLISIHVSVIMLWEASCFVIRI